jgi:hypothetical protein
MLAKCKRQQARRAQPLLKNTIGNNARAHHFRSNTHSDAPALKRPRQADLKNSVKISPEKECRPELLGWEHRDASLL